MTAFRSNLNTIVKIAAILLVLAFCFAVTVFGAQASSLELKMNPETNEVVYGNHFPDGVTQCKDARISSCESGMWTTHFIRRPSGNEADIRLVYDDGMVEFRCETNRTHIDMIAFGSYNGKKVEKIQALTFYTNMRQINFRPVPDKDLVYSSIPRGSQLANDLPETELTFSNRSGVLMHFQWDDENIRTNYRQHMKVFLELCKMNSGSKK